MDWYLRMAARQLSFDFYDPLPTRVDLDNQIPDMVSATQKAYDQWEQDADGMNDELGAGGICQDIAEEIAGVLSLSGIDAGTVSASVGDQHVYVLAKLADGVYEVDISPRLYESGSGYTWKKKPGVKFDPSMISVFRISGNPNDFEQMME